MPRWGQERLKQLRSVHHGRRAGGAAPCCLLLVQPPQQLDGHELQRHTGMRVSNGAACACQMGRHACVKWGART